MHLVLLPFILLSADIVNADRWWLALFDSHRCSGSSRIVASSATEVCVAATMPTLLDDVAAASRILRRVADRIREDAHCAEQSLQFIEQVLAAFASEFDLTLLARPSLQNQLRKGEKTKPKATRLSGWSGSSGGRRPKRLPSRNSWQWSTATRCGGALPTYGSSALAWRPPHCRPERWRSSAATSCWRNGRASQDAPSRQCATRSARS